MTHYDVRYDGNDANALRDIVDYLTEKQWNLLCEAAMNNTHVSHLDMALHIAGIQGFPVFAFIRTFRPNEYDAWVASLED